MPRWRFLPGLLLGLILGLPLGAIIALFGMPPCNTDSSVAALQVGELSRRLVETQRDKEDLGRQLEEFRTLAERMTTSFRELERRFTAMEEEMRRREQPASSSAPNTPPATEPAQ
ncbi:MAG: hypothetical protein HY699_08690 [Deltaproteobacteria bacterium]|nr:hypothetical protein [Deltaproteobacteria bacterium]